MMTLISNSAAGATGKGALDGSPVPSPLVREIQALAASEYPMCDEARALLALAVRAQSGESIDLVTELARLRAERDHLRTVARRYLNVPELQHS